MKGEQLAFVKDDGITLADGNTVTSHSFQTALFPRNIPSREITQLSPDELQSMATNEMLDEANIFRGYNIHRICYNRRDV